MRLKQADIGIIKKLTANFFGSDALVYLFGSRTDDTKYGGDIDLLIQCKQEEKLQNIYQRKLRFLVELKKRMEDQRIDVLVDTGNLDKRIIQSALQTGIKL